MTERIESLLNRTFDREQARFRRDVDWAPLLARFVAEGTPDEARARIGREERLRAEGEAPAFLDGERIAFTRTIRQIPDLHTDAEMEAAGAVHGQEQTYSFHHAELALLENEDYAEWLFSFKRK